MQENEVAMFFIGLMIFILSLLYKEKLKVIPAGKYLYASFILLMQAWTFTIVEGFFLYTFFNIMEHVMYLLSALGFIIWVIAMVNSQKVHSCK